MTHPSPKRNLVPKAVLMRSGLVSLTTARPINTAQPRTTMEADDQAIQIFLLGLLKRSMLCDELRTAPGNLIAQPVRIWGQRQTEADVGANGGKSVRHYAGQNGYGYQNVYNAVQNVRNRGVQDAVQNHVGFQIWCYNCRGMGILAEELYSHTKRDMDACISQTQLLIAQKEEAGIQLQAEEFDLMAAAADLDEIKEVNANCILMANLQQASTSGTQTDKLPSMTQTDQLRLILSSQLGVYNTANTEGHSLGAIQRMIGSLLRLRVVASRIKKLK
ncbi:hypothetical protein Tco_1313283 [Tanacetum coccineum]